MMVSAGMGSAGGVSHAGTPTNTTGTCNSRADSHACARPPRMSSGVVSFPEMRIADQSAKRQPRGRRDFPQHVRGLGGGGGGGSCKVDHPPAGVMHQRGDELSHDDSPVGIAPEIDDAASGGREQRLPCRRRHGRRIKPCHAGVGRDQLDAKFTESAAWSCTRK